MEKFELEPALAEEIRSRVLGEGFMKLVQSVRRGGTNFKISLRPVMIGGVRKFQAEMTDDGDVRVKNFDANGIIEGLEEIIAQKGARELHLMTATGDLHVRVTKKGHVLQSRSEKMNRTVEVRGNDRVKNLPLTSFDATALLRGLDIADGEGKVRASMRGKYDQVNEFLKVVRDTVGEMGERPKTFTIVDCGCGKAYLTFSLWFYLTHVLEFPAVKVIGIDRREDVIKTAQAIAQKLDVAEQVIFYQQDLETFSLPENGVERVDMVVSLHACDTATDEALARGVEWKARYILSAPCCQHELQKALQSGSPAGSERAAFAGLMRHNILRERLCDLLTDSFRAMILRMLGFKTNVIEFVSPDATARNVMIRCEYGVKAGQPGVVSEYLNLRDFWGVTPWLETRLEALLKKYLERFK